MRILNERCPRAFKDLDKESAQIVVDHINRATYDILITSINGWLSTSATKKIKTK